MKSYVWLTFAFMGWAYYEVSGGSEFEPEAVAMAEVVEPAKTPDIVARAENTTLLSISSSNVEPQPVVTDAEITQAVAEAVAIDTVEDVVVEAAAPAVEPVVDLRSVSGSRVNMRMGPSTDFEVITTLNSGTELEVLDVNAEGWANVMIVSSGIEGWMAERLLSDPQT